MQSKDGLELFIQQYDITAPKGMIALVHGLGEHGGRYVHWAKYFNEAGYALMTFDLRGHGKSEGKRGFVPSFDALLDDVTLFIAEAQSRYPAIPIFLYGHSLGGCIVLSYLLHRKPRLKGVIATSSFITLGFKPSPIMVGIGKLMNKIYPAFTQDNQLDINHISHDANVVKAYADDPLVHSKLSSALGIGMLEQGDFIHNYKGNIDTPLLLVHGSDDKITNPQGTIDFYNNTSGNRTLKILEGLYHETHNEPQQHEVFEQILGWVNEQNK